jgi:acyl-CoA thioester hydrolase
MPRILLHTFRVPREAIDVNGHVNNLEYLRWMQDVAVMHSVARGWPLERYQATRTAWVVRSHSIEYLAPAFADDTLTLATWVADLRPRSSTRRYLVWRASDRRVVAEAHTLWVFVDTDTGRPRSILDELCASFEIVPDRAEVMRLLEDNAAAATPSSPPVAAGRSAPIPVPEMPR